MKGLFTNIQRLFTYMPATTEDFELLEGGAGESGRESQEAAPEVMPRIPELDGEKEGKGKDPKAPMTVDEWNRARVEERESKPLALQDVVSHDLKLNLQKIKQEFNVPVNNDIVIRNFKIGKKTNAFIAFIDGMVDRATVNHFILQRLMSPEYFDDFKKDCLLEYVADNVLPVNEAVALKDFDWIVQQMLSGLTALFIDGCNECLMIETRGYEKRSVERPATENVVKGPQEGFTENMRTNITLVRRIIKNKNLVSEMMTLGKRGHSMCTILYIEGLANPQLIKEVKRRIKGIDVDFVLGDGMLNQLIRDNSLMLFPQILSTERPDRTASFLMEGQVALMPEGTPFASVVPVTFYHMFQTSEDASLSWQFGTLLRLIRLFGLLSAALLPGLYIALTAYHQEMIPTELLSAIAKTRENVPFPVFVEVILMEISFELIREAGVRVPGVIGQTLGIIGALILGQAAVAANIVSPVVIIVVALTGLGSFAVPSFSMGFGIRVMRFIIIFFAAIAGFYGISAALFIIGSIACAMKSFGVPFFAPVAPATKGSNDLFFRQPIWRQDRRPDYINPLNRKRQGKPPKKWEDKKKGGGNRD